MCGEDGQFTYCWHDDIMQGKVAPEVGRIVSSYLKTDLPSTNCFLYRDVVKMIWGSVLIPFSLWYLCKLKFGRVAYLPYLRKKKKIPLLTFKIVCSIKG